MEKRIFVVDSTGKTEEKKFQVKDKKPEAKFIVDEEGKISENDKTPEWKKKLEELTGKIKPKK